MLIPKGYHPVTWTEILEKFRPAMPSLGPALYRHLNLPESAVLPRITALEQKALIQFALSPSGQPSVFIAPGTDQGFAPYASENEHAFANALVSFWDLTGKFDAKDGHIVSASTDVGGVPLGFIIRTPEKDLAVAASVAWTLRDKGLITEDEHGMFHGASKAQVMEWIRENGICDFCSVAQPSLATVHVDSFMLIPEVEHESIGGWAACDVCHQLILKNRRRDLLQRSIAANGKHSIAEMEQIAELALKDLHNRFWKVWDRARQAPELPKLVVPHWQMALDQKVNAINELKLFEQLSPSHPKIREIQWIDLQTDLTVLRLAEVYSFSAETMHAIITGSQSIPCESSLKSVEIPNVRAGWFWFAEPFPIASSPIASDTTAALLWSWATDTKTPTLRFSAYVIDEKGVKKKGQILPSGKWIWPVTLSFHEMLALNTQLYRDAYGPTGPFHREKYAIGEEGTLKVVAKMSLFFLMACLWFRQTVPGTKRKIDSVPDANTRSY